MLDNNTSFNEMHDLQLKLTAISKPPASNLFPTGINNDELPANPQFSFVQCQRMVVCSYAARMLFLSMKTCGRKQLRADGKFTDCRITPRKLEHLFHVFTFTLRRLMDSPQNGVLHIFLCSLTRKLVILLSSGIGVRFGPECILLQPSLWRPRCQEYI